MRTTRKVKVIAAVCGAICVILVLFHLYSHTAGAAVIGTASGPEWEYITIDGRTYALDTSTGFSSADKGRFLGTVTGGDVAFRIYSVKGDGEERYLYRLWDWEGAFYRLTDEN